MAEPQKKDPAEIPDEDFDIAAFSDAGSGDVPEEGPQGPQEPQPESQPEAQPESEPQQDRGDLNVALSESRQELRELKEKFLEQQGMYKQLVELVQRGQQPREEAPKEPEKPKEPDDPRPEVPDINSVGLEEYLAANHKLQLWYERQTARQKARQDEQERVFREFLERQQQVQQQALQGNQLTMAIAQQEQEFSRNVPEYLQALQFLEQNLVEDYMVENFLPREKAAVIVRQDLIARAQHRLAEGGNVPAMMYALAKRRGYGAQGGVSTMVQQQPEKRTPSPAAQAEAALTGATGAPAPSNSLQALIDADERDFLTGQADMMKMLRGG